MFNQNKDHKSFQLTNGPEAARRVVDTLFSVVIGAAVGIGVSALSEKTVSTPEDIKPELPVKVTDTLSYTELPNIQFPISEITKDPATALISPLAVGDRKTNLQERKIEINIPMQYFTTVPANPKDYKIWEQKALNYIQKEIKEQTKPTINSPFGNETLANLTKRNSNNLGKAEINSAYIQAGSSQERIENGVNSVKQGAVNVQNIELAKNRANFISGLAQKLGVKQENLQVKSAEIQFTQNQRTQMVNYAKSLNLKGDEDEQIFEIAKLVNSNQKIDPKIKQIFENNRFAKINLTLTVENKEITIYGIPLLLIPSLLGVSVAAAYLYNQSKKLKIETLNPNIQISEIKLPEIKFPKIPNPNIPDLGLKKIPEWIYSSLSGIWNKMPKNITSQLPREFPNDIYTAPNNAPSYLKITTTDKFIPDNIAPNSVRKDGLKLKEIVENAGKLIRQELVKSNINFNDPNQVRQFHVNVFQKIAEDIKTQIVTFNNERSAQADYFSPQNGLVRAYVNNQYAEITYKEYREMYLPYYPQKQAIIIYEMVWEMIQNPKSFTLTGVHTNQGWGAGTRAAKNFRDNNLEN